ncbi:hypothetical protein C2U70_28755 [Bradyrhizobium guangdongense]|uniref:ABC1 kinase family protein n=1 Tax=Bradyrhizobium guangdongense TaxID=1325090 RepID=UPI00112DEEA9|nr:AarF/UbiB family protein [Bradyrhizobium guangdongense]TPQ29164.1 hypothetical protein C2U70_28755 [Bradyrhizobium guangdongense]
MMDAIASTVWRFWQICATTFRCVILPAFRPAAACAPLPVRVREAIERLGGVWIKVGQALSLRFDLLPREYCDEFLKLLGETATFPYSEVRTTIRNEFGQSPEELFASFASVPLAAASIAQVHLATDNDGTRLAVKIKKPGIERQFKADFRIMRMLARCLRLVSGHLGSSARTFLDEFERWTIEELDFRNEARHGHRFALFAKGDPLQATARVRFEFTTSDVLTTEFLDGVRVLDIVTALRARDLTRLAEFRRRGIEPVQVARNIAWNLLNQALRDGFFHADMHPANLIALPGNVIAYLDFGIVGTLSDDLRESLQRYLVYLVECDFGRAVDEMLRWMGGSERSNMEAARQDLMLMFEGYRYGTGANEGRPLQLTSDFIIDMMSAARRYDLAIAPEMILYQKAVLSIDATFSALAPGHDLFLEAGKFFRRATRIDLYDMARPSAAAVLDVAHQMRCLASDFRSTQGVGRTFRVWLDMLQARLLSYEFWAILLGVGAYVVYQDDRLQDFPRMLGVSRYWIAGGLALTAIALLAPIWRQGRRLSATDPRDHRGRAHSQRTRQ